MTETEAAGVPAGVEERMYAVATDKQMHYIYATSVLMAVVNITVMFPDQEVVSVALSVMAEHR